MTQVGAGRVPPRLVTMARIAIGNGGYQARQISALGQLRTVGDFPKTGHS